MLAIIGGWFAARWCLADTVAEFAPPVEEGGIDTANMAVSWAPDDPLPHMRLAALYQKQFNSENLAAAVRECQLAVQAAPYDYRYWMELARALEANGDPDNAEKAMHRAVELAPSYSQPQWFYGNMLLRQGKTDEAFVHLSQAAAGDEGIREEVFNVAWEVFDQNLDSVVKAVPSPEVRLQFVVYLIARGKFDQAAAVLRSVSESDRAAHVEITREIVKSLMARHQYHAALTMDREIESDPGIFSGPEKIWNGGFETAITSKDETPFHWYITTSALAQISRDTTAHDGNGSLRIVFRAPNNLQGIDVSQIVIVEPQTAYRLQFYQRADSLLSGGTPGIAVLDPSDNSSLGSSPPLATGKHDWQQVTIDFKTKLTDGIQIVVYRSACGDNQSICPIFGTVWYDDFDLQRVGGSGSQPRDGNGRKR